MIPDYKNMTTDHLVDLLAHETQRFTQFMLDKEFTSEYSKCKRSIEKIQHAIESRNLKDQEPPRSSSSSPESNSN
jgi:hypothetical protein